MAGPPRRLSPQPKQEEIGKQRDDGQRDIQPEIQAVSRTFQPPPGKEQHEDDIEKLHQENDGQRPSGHPHIGAGHFLVEIILDFSVYPAAEKGADFRSIGQCVIPSPA